MFVPNTAPSPWIYQPVNQRRLEKFRSEELYPLVFPEQVPLEGKSYRASHRIEANEGIKNFKAKFPTLEPSFQASQKNNIPINTLTIVKQGNVQFHSAWDTHWIQIETTVPKGWDPKQTFLFFDSSSEACCFSKFGEPIQGLNGSHDGENLDRDIRRYVSLGRIIDNNSIECYIEVSCNGMFGIIRSDVTNVGTLKHLALARKNPEAWELFHDFDVLLECAKALPSHSGGATALLVANAFCNACNPQDPSTWPLARSIAKQYLTHQSTMANALIGGHLGPLTDTGLPLDMSLGSIQPNPANGPAAATNVQKSQQISSVASPKLAPARNLNMSHPVFTVTALGHCHIDSAWLWPKAETVRKVYRSWATQTLYAESYPHYKFVASQAAQYDWVLRYHPALWRRIQKAVKNGQFYPIGGTWVEPDLNVPSGEGLIRQFVLGQAFFFKHFGFTSNCFFAPDSFGYSGNLPQIIRHCGASGIITQKLSWNRYNKPAHSTFVWKGIGPGAILCHFPPADTYNANGRPDHIFKSFQDYKDHHLGGMQSLLLYGWGDGGGGPDLRMLEHLNRVIDSQLSSGQATTGSTNGSSNDPSSSVTSTSPAAPISPKATSASKSPSFAQTKSHLLGMPHVVTQGPEQFMSSVARDINGRAALHQGEHFFEFHIGVTVSQSNTKRMNRKLELAVRDLEILASIAQLAGKAVPAETGHVIESIWKIICFNHFHDILPGSSIKPVYDDAMVDYVVGFRSLCTLRNQLCSLLSINNAISIPDIPKFIKHTDTERYTTPELDATSIDLLVGPYIQKDLFAPPADAFSSPKLSITNTLSVTRPPQLVFDPQCKSYVSLPSVPPLSTSVVPFTTKHSFGTVSLNETPLAITLFNQLVSVSFSKSTGQITSMVYEGRELSQSGQRFTLFDDNPSSNWIAWDIDHYYIQKVRKTLSKPVSVQFSSNNSSASVVITYALGKESTLSYTCSLIAGSNLVDFTVFVSNWAAEPCLKNVLLSFDFDTNISSPVAHYEIPHGYVSRPTHHNTSFDFARFHCPVYRWATLNESNGPQSMGCAIINDGKYGMAIQNGTLRLSLLRATDSPDPMGDIGSHRIKFALMPHTGGFQAAGVIPTALAYNSPLIIAPLPEESSVKSIPSVCTVQPQSVLVDVIKAPCPILSQLTEWQNSNKALIFRFVESLGVSTNASIQFGLCGFHTPTSVFLTNGIEKLEAPIQLLDNSSIQLRFRPFEIKTIKVYFE